MSLQLFLVVVPLKRRFSFLNATYQPFDEAEATETIETLRANNTRAIQALQALVEHEDKVADEDKDQQEDDADLA